ncbi:MAG: RagB/SusD family nutrient uptake outer membrane protein, partial [Bacteroidales bacterium]|nr:RagB/SusD family nutrient uptake outer membrane protein [Bacteroidales bacterium]
MKHIKYFVIALGLAAVVGSGCSGDLLNVESKTAATSDYLYSTSEGLQKAVVGLYDIERELVVGDNSPVGIPILLDASTDLVLYRGGTTASLFRLDNNTSSTGYFKTYWTAFYTIIGKSNEIIEGAKKLGLEDPDVARVYGEASLFRA